MSTTPTFSPRPHPAALLACLLGVVSLPLCPLGPVALWLGVRALRSINRSEGMDTGRVPAWVGIVLGALTTAITVVGIVALIIVRSQTNSMRLGSSENMRQIGVAFQRYAEDKNALPPATRVPPRLPPAERLSYNADILGLMAQDRRVGQGYAEMSGRLDRDRGWGESPNLEIARLSVRTLVSPGYHVEREEGSPAMTTYVATAGLGVDAAMKRRDSADAGAFGHDRGVAFKEATAGISNTTMMMETGRDNGPWLAGGEPTVRGLGVADETPLGRGRAFGGLHAGVTHVLFMDGSVRPMSDGTRAEILRELVRLRR